MLNIPVGPKIVKKGAPRYDGCIERFSTSHLVVGIESSHHQTKQGEP
ncbi:hypothetical protein FHS14_000567 [Paenibacillus baekrokdamisoli]|nr:hypothetical protein [Paenibacillus baekrokdamisoli]